MGHGLRVKALGGAFVVGSLILAACGARQELTAQEIANYAGLVRFSSFKVGVSENMAGHSLYYIDAVVQNGGDRTITELRVNAGFRDVDGQVVFKDAALVIHPRRRGLGPRESRGVRMGFEGVPATWNRAAPDIEIIHLAFEP